MNLGLIWSVTGFADEHALILYVYLNNYDDEAEESVLTVCLLTYPYYQAVLILVFSIISLLTVNDITI